MSAAMQLLEISFQGIRGFSKSGRVSLQPGYTVLKPPASGCALGGLLSAVLYADGRGAEASFAAPGAGPAQLGLTLQGNDQSSYRLTRTLGGSGALEKLTPAAEAISSDSVEMLQYLRGAAGLPTRNLFDGLFTLSSGQLPSRAKKPAAPQTTPSRASPALAQSQIAPAGDLAEAQARLKTLEQERAVSSEIDKVQFKLDGLAAEAFEVEAKLKSTDGLEDQIARAEADAAQAPTPESMKLPADILARCQKYPAAVTKRDEALAKIADEREAEANAIEASVPSITRDNRFWIGIAVGVLALVAGALTEGSARYLALLDIPAFGFSAVLGLQYVDDLKHSQKKKGKGSRLAEREKKVRDQFEAEAGPVKAAMKTLSVESPQDVVDILGRKGQLELRAAELRLQLEAAKADPEWAQARAKLDGLRREQEKLNAELQAKGGYIRDAREVEREIERVKESIALARAPRAAPAQALGSASGPAETLADPFPAVLKLASDLWQTDVPTIGAQLKDRAGQYLAALTDKRYVAYEFDKDGRGALLGAAGGKMPAGSLTPGDLDLAYLALRLTIAEKSQGAMPLVIEDAVEAIPAAKQPLIGKMIKQLSSQTQVLHATAHPGFAQVAGAVVPI
jgi:hypothetical protein